MARSTDPGSERSPQEMDERAAFRKQVTPYLGELLAAARRVAYARKHLDVLEQGRIP